MNEINAICVRNSWGHSDLAKAMNEFLNAELQFTIPLTTKERVSLNRWRAIQEEHWVKATGDFLLAFQNVRSKYAPN